MRLQCRIRGSSPHTRGARLQHSCWLHLHWDHPRIRGEHSRLTTFSRNGTRIIPAYAGSTFMYFTATWRSVGSSPHTRGARCAANTARGGSGDHPRIRGEHVVHPAERHVPAGIIPAYAGSTHALQQRCAAAQWIIPAYAGSTACLR